MSDEPAFPIEPPPPRRRRATRRSYIPTDAEGQAALIATLARRAYPSWELFVFSLLSGAILGLGYLLNSQALIFLAVLIAPLMTAWFGFLLAVLSGSLRFLFETKMALLISLIFVFLGGLLAGFASLLFPLRALDNVYLHTRLWIPEMIVLALGALILVASFVRSENKPYLPSVVVAYALFPPAGAAGFSVSAGLSGVWLNGLLVLLVHFAWISAVGLITLFVLKLRPLRGGYFWSALSLIAFAVLLFIFARPAPSSKNEATTIPQTTPTNAVVAAPPSQTPILIPSLEATFTPKVLSATPSPTTQATLEITLPPAHTPTVTMTVPPTPTYAKISANQGGGANLREAPDGKYVMTLLNGTIVETFSEFQVVNGRAWVKVYVAVNGQRVEGWLLETVIAYATPAPNFEASPAPKSSATP
ncbi:MAG: DUF389 domain-containing protein [Anaerolineales bacterium]|nr:DUF389 domain-containing protein [Anaerolineales bacterium]